MKIRPTKVRKAQIIVAALYNMRAGYPDTDDKRVRKLVRKPNFELDPMHELAVATILHW